MMVNFERINIDYFLPESTSSRTTHDQRLTLGELYAIIGVPDDDGPVDLCTQFPPNAADVSINPPELSCLVVPDDPTTITIEGSLIITTGSNTRYTTQAIKQICHAATDKPLNQFSCQRQLKPLTKYSGSAELPVLPNGTISWATIFRNSEDPSNTSIFKLLNYLAGAEYQKKREIDLEPAINTIINVISVGVIGYLLKTIVSLIRLRNKTNNQEGQSNSNSHTMQVAQEDYTPTYTSGPIPLAKEMPIFVEEENIFIPPRSKKKGTSFDVEALAYANIRNATSHDDSYALMLRSKFDGLIRSFWDALKGLGYEQDDMRDLPDRSQILAELLVQKEKYEHGNIFQIDAAREEIARLTKIMELLDRAQEVGFNSQFKEIQKRRRKV